jgi:hypothetical protein
MGEHSTFDTLINRFLDARSLLQETRWKLGELVQGTGIKDCPDSETITELCREIDEYLANVGAGQVEDDRGGAAQPV